MNCIDNPPAFPRPASRGNNYLTGEENVVVDPQQGMTLLDYFAGQAIWGLTSRYGQQFSARWLAQQAYQIAKAMLDARKVFL